MQNLKLWWPRDSISTHIQHHYTNIFLGNKQLRYSNAPHWFINLFISLCLSESFWSSLIHEIVIRDKNSSQSFIFARFYFCCVWLFEIAVDFKFLMKLFSLLYVITSQFTEMYNMSNAACCTKNIIICCYKQRHNSDYIMYMYVIYCSIVLYIVTNQSVVNSWHKKKNEDILYNVTSFLIFVRFVKFFASSSNGFSIMIFTLMIPHITKNKSILSLSFNVNRLSLICNNFLFQLEMLKCTAFMKYEFNDNFPKLESIIQ